MGKKYIITNTSEGTYNVSNPIAHQFIGYPNLSEFEEEI